MGILQKILESNTLNINLNEIEEKLNNCSAMRTEIEFVKGTGSNSSSATDTYILNIKQDAINERLKQNNQFFMKLFVSDAKILYDPSKLIYEQEIYRFTNKLLIDGTTRNLVPLVAYSRQCTFSDICMMLSNKDGCDEEIRQQLVFNLATIVCSADIELDHKRKAITPNQIIKFSKKETKYFEDCADVMGVTGDEFADTISNMQLGFIMTKSAQGSGNFKYSFGKGLINDDEMIQHIFQIFYTLYEFQLQGLNHNDLHLENILMDQRWPSELPIALYITSTGKAIPIKTKEVSRIFDYDRSTMKKNPNKLEWLAEYGQVNEFSPQRDFLRLGCTLTSYLGLNLNIFKKSYDALLDSLELVPNSIESEKSKSGNCYLAQSDGTSLLANDEWMGKHIRKPVDIIDKLSDYVNSGCTISDFTSQTKSKIKLQNNVYIPSNKTNKKEKIFNCLNLNLNVNK